MQRLTEPTVGRDGGSVCRFALRHRERLRQSSKAVYIAIRA